MAYENHKFPIIHVHFPVIIGIISDVMKSGSSSTNQIPNDMSRSWVLITAHLKSCGARAEGNPRIISIFGVLLKGKRGTCGWWLRNPARKPPGMVLKPCKSWGNLPINWLAGFLNHQQYDWWMLQKCDRARPLEDYLIFHMFSWCFIYFWSAPHPGCQDATRIMNHFSDRESLPKNAFVTGILGAANGFYLPHVWCYSLNTLVLK